MDVFGEPLHKQNKRDRKGEQFPMFGIDIGRA
jgi:hypothetical protein